MQECFLSYYIEFIKKNKKMLMDVMDNINVTELKMSNTIQMFMNIPLKNIYTTLNHEKSPQDEQEYGEHVFKFEYYMCHAFIKD
jgi:hypothetical protein